MNGRRIYHARGKVLGGSSSINGMIFQRGNPLDYERWAADPGMADWDYAHCLPYFKRMETCLAAAADDPFRGHSGPLVLERGPATSPLFTAFFAAVQQAGYALTEDVNGYRQEGFAAFDRNIHRGRRLSAARAYLHPVMKRPNLEVRTSAFVTRIVFDGRRAIGVEVALGRGRSELIRGREIVLCGGAIDSPQVLQLSGVGAAGELQALGIDVVQDLPGVGEHLQDHLEVYVQHACTQPVSMQPSATQKWRRPWIGFQWLFFRRGPGATNHFEGGGFARSNEEVDYPNLMFHFLPLAIRYDGSAGARRPRLPGPHRADVLGLPGLGEDRLDRPAGPPRAPLQLPVDGAGPARVGRGDPGRPVDPRPARVRAVRRRRDVARPVGRDRPADPRLGRPGRRDRPPPVVHLPDGHRRRLGGRPADDARPRSRRAAGRRRLGRCRTSRTATSTRR